MLFVVSKKKYRELDDENIRLLNIIIQKNKVIEGQEKDIDLLKIEVRNVKRENEIKDRNIRSLEDSNKLNIDKITTLEKNIELDKNKHLHEIERINRLNKRNVRDKHELERKYEEELKEREEAEANLSKAVARNMVDDMTIQELEHYTDKLESDIEILKTNIETSQEMKRQILDFLELKDEKGNRKIEKGCVLVHSCVSGEYIWRLARLI